VSDDEDEERGGDATLDGLDVGETGGTTLAALAGGGVGEAVEPAMTAGADNPPAVTIPARMPAATEPLAGTLVAEATTAWATGVDETCVTSWIPAWNGAPASIDAADGPVVTTPDATTCEPAAPADSPALAKTRRRTVRTGAVSRIGTVAQAPFTAFAAPSACWSFARARRTRARAFTSLIPRVPATSS